MTVPGCLSGKKINATHIVMPMAEVSKTQRKHKEFVNLFFVNSLYSNTKAYCLYRTHVKLSKKFGTILKFKLIV